MVDFDLSNYCQYDNTFKRTYVIYDESLVNFIIEYKEVCEIFLSFKSSMQVPTSYSYTLPCLLDEEGYVNCTVKGFIITGHRLILRITDVTVAVLFKLSF